MMIGRGCLPIARHDESVRIGGMEDSRLIMTGHHSRQVGLGGVPALKVVALYDGFISAVYAHEAVGSLAMAVRPFMDVESSAWSFAMLSRLDLRHPSIREAAEADMIIIAADASLPLPPHIRTWLTRSLQENGKGAPLIVAIHEEDAEQAEATSPLHEDLGYIAERWGTPLLRNGEYDAHLERGLAGDLASRRGSHGTSVEFDRLFSAHPTGAWGINE